VRVLSRIGCGPRGTRRRGQRNGAERLSCPPRRLSRMAKSPSLHLEVPMPSQPSPSLLRTLRTGLWHLRKGGVAQLRTWQRRQRTASFGIADASGSADGSGGLSFPEAALPGRPPHLDGLRVAVILDDFSMLAWSYEFETIAVTPEGWREQLAETPVDLLLV